MPASAIVTGATRGIGEACCIHLAKDGYDIAVNHHSESSKEAAQALCAKLHDEFGVDAIAVQGDVSSFDDAKQMVDEAMEHFGQIDVLVNNAGITRDGLLMRMKEDQFESVIDTNLGGAFNCMRHVAPIMVKARSGSIVNISSVVGVYGNAGQVNYSASKAGIIGLTKSAAKELGGRGVRVNAIAPGFIETAMTENLGEKAQAALESSIALKRLGSPDDVANAVSFLASDAASYITGQVLEVSGGIAL